MKEEKLQQLPQKSKGQSKNTLNNLHATNFNNLKEIDKFFDSYNLPKLNQEEIEKMNRPITSKEIKMVIKNLPKKQKSRTRCLLWRILPNIQTRFNTHASQTIPNS